jgi:GNAT superfamily N-acetyltransferase
MVRAAATYRVTAGNSTALYAIAGDRCGKGGGNRLVFYGSQDRDRVLLRPEDLRALDFLVLHEDFYRVIAGELAGCRVQTSRPLIYEAAAPPPVAPNAAYAVIPFDFDEDGADATAAALINRCYEGHHHTAAEVAGWREQPAFDPALWLWVRHKTTGEPAGLGISTYQPAIRETYLDWIQILPSHHGRGLGRMLVGETLRRALPKSDITRVTGIADAFYKKCGFVNRETWYVITRDVPASPA